MSCAALAVSDADEQLHAAVDEVHLERHERGALGPRAIGELADCAASRQGRNARWPMLSAPARGRVFADVHAVQAQIDRCVGRPHVPFGEAHLPVSDALDLRTEELHAALERVLDDVVVPRLAVLDRGLVRAALALAFLADGHGK